MKLVGWGCCRVSCCETTVSGVDSDGWACSGSRAGGSCGAWAKLGMAAVGVGIWLMVGIDGAPGLPMVGVGGVIGVAMVGVTCCVGSGGLV